MAAKQWSSRGEDDEIEEDLELSSEEELVIEVGGGKVVALAASTDW